MSHSPSYVALPIDQSRYNNNSLMYKRPLETIRKESIRPNHLMQRTDDHERFSSFESPPASDNDHEEFSDFETSRQKAKCPPEGSSSCKKQRSHILVEQLPLQSDNLPSSRKKQGIGNNGERSEGKLRGSQTRQGIVASGSSKGESSRLKENCPQRYNYMERVERQLSTIPQDAKEELRESGITSLYTPAPFPLAKVTPFDSIWKTSDLLYNDPNIALLQKQSLEMLMLQQENKSLRERVVVLERELKVRDEDRLRKDAEIIVERTLTSIQEDQLYSTRKEAKLKLVEEVALLQSRCREMKQEMRQYREKQEEHFARLAQQREDAKLQVIRLKSAHEYQAKFTEVFLNMVEKLPVDLEESWSKKRKIAVGWKVVKYLVKKAFKLGIHPPAIAQKSQPFD